MDSSSKLGYSVQKQAIEMFRLTQGPVSLLLIGGVHGDEVEGVELVKRFMLAEQWHVFDQKASLYVIPQLNPDGCQLYRRWNARGVDLNRNMPTQDWSAERKSPRYTPGVAPGSEPETQGLVHCLETLKPALIISAHSSYSDLCVDYNGPARPVAAAMSAVNGYRVTDYIGYPTPGSLGTWAGWERQIPTITLEIERACPNQHVWQRHGAAILQGFMTAVDLSS